MTKKSAVERLHANDNTWMRSSDVNNNVISDCVLKLRGFHMCMAFLGAIGHLMQGSG